MLILFMVALIVAPEKAMPGSSTEPARSLALIFASRTVLLGIALIVLSAKGLRHPLAWVLFADAAFQIFDTGIAIRGGNGAVALLPVTLGVLEVLAGVALMRGARAAPVTAAR